MRISVKSNIRESVARMKRYSKYHRKAAAESLHQLGRHASAGVRRQARQDLDRPTAFTIRGFRQKPGGFLKPEHLDKGVLLFVSPIQARYLIYQVYGGTERSRSKSGLLVPIKENLDKHGNFPRRARNRIKKGDAHLKTARYVTQKKGNDILLWRMPKGKGRAKPKLLLVFKDQITYKKRFRYHERIEKEVEKNFRRVTEREYAKQMRRAFGR